MIVWLTIGLAIQALNLGALAHFGALPSVRGMPLRVQVALAALLLVTILLWPIVLVNAYRAMRRVQRGEPPW